jgi:small-conductance mechanosensitive channel
MPPLHRVIGNPVLSWIGRTLFSIPVGDFHCGMRGFNTASIRKLGLITSGMEFASEMVIRASLEGLKMAEVPTTLAVDGRSRAPHLKTWRDGWRHLKLLLMYSPKWLFLFPGLFLMLAGVIMQGLLWFGPLALANNLTLDSNSYAAACFMLIAGVQLFGFGVLARYYATLTGLLPRGKRSDAIYRLATTDTIVRLGAIALILGLGIFGYALWVWSQVGFGELTDMPHVSRAVLSGLSLIVISIQLGFGAFMIGILRMPLVARGVPDIRA